MRLGNTLPRSELVKLAEYRLGGYCCLYRHSGRVLDASPNDIKNDFIAFLQWHSFNGTSAESHVIATVKKFEQNPDKWDVLLNWLQTWQEVHHSSLKKSSNSYEQLFIAHFLTLNSGSERNHGQRKKQSNQSPKINSSRLLRGFREKYDRNRKPS